MLTLIHHLSGRPWAVRPEAAEYLRGVLLKEGVAGLRDLAALRSALMVSDDDDDGPRPAARASAVTARNGATVAVIPVIGPLTQRGGLDLVTCQGFRSTDAIAAEVRAAAAEPKVDAIVLEVDSPGGEVFGVPEGWQAIRESAKVKPIVAAVNSVSASAAYYLTSASTEVWVNPSGQVGSIGVYCLHVDISKALEGAGERWTFISAGRYKLEGNPLEPLGDEARASIQAQVDSYYADFVRDVSRGRGVGVETVRAGFGEGRMVRARAAVEQRMADHVGTIDQAIRRAAVLSRERREPVAPAARRQSSTPAASTPAAGINDAPNLAEGTAERSCLSCEYYSKPAPASNSGACSLYDFTSEDMWVCDSWEGEEAEAEAETEPTPEPAPGPDEPTMTKEQLVARALLRVV
jgi:capsid assembly protease